GRAWLRAAPGAGAAFRRSVDRGLIGCVAANGGRRAGSVAMGTTQTSSRLSKWYLLPGTIRIKRRSLALNVGEIDHAEFPERSLPVGIIRNEGTMTDKSREFVEVVSLVHPAAHDEGTGGARCPFQTRKERIGV